MRLASYEDFNNGTIYTKYPLPEGVYERRARLFRHFPDPILVVGCGFGGLVKALELVGKVVWGIDASDYVLEHKISQQVVYGNILDLSEWKHGAFETLISEDLLPHLTDEEVKVAARNCQALASIVIHMVTERGQADLNYHSTAYWMNLTGQLTISLEGM